MDFEDRARGDLIGGEIGLAWLALVESSTLNVGFGDGLDFRVGDLTGVSGLDLSSGLDCCDFRGVSGSFSRFVGDSGLGLIGSCLLFDRS